MKKNAIWLVVALMGAALMSIIILQAYWISSAKDLNEENFDREVRTALNQVSDGLEEYEELELSRKKPISKAGLAMASKKKGLLKSDDLLIARGIDVATLKDKTMLNDKTERIQQQFYNARKPAHLASKIDPKFLHERLGKELENRGIDIGYEYGVYSFKDAAYIIRNGNYVISEFESNQVTDMSEGESTLDKSEYAVDLFTNMMNSPGKLIVYFPNKSSIVWGGAVWRTLIASIISSAIVLFCFTYTINVIFAQKKLSEMKTDFINNMTHEFKTPIATISLAADSITSPQILSNTNKIKRFADIIKQENKRMNKQVEKVLQMATLDKEDFKLKLSQVNLHEVISQAAINARPLHCV